MRSDKAEEAQRIVERLNAHDPEGMAALLHPEFEFFSLLASVDGRTYRGIEGLREYSADIEETWDDARFELEELHQTAEGAFVVMRVYGRARASGVPLDQRTWQVWTWHEGKVWRNVVYLDPAQARAAAGMEPLGRAEAGLE